MGNRIRWAPAALAAALALAAGPALPPEQAQGAEGKWRPALPGYVFRFPRDHGAHPAFRTEWWYFSGNLRGPGGRRYAFMLTFFRTGLRPPSAGDPPRRSRWALRDLYFAHLSLLDVAADRRRAFERFSRGALEEAGAAQGRLRVWLRDWRAEGRGDGPLTEIRLAAGEGGAGLRLSLVPLKPPVVHGEGGVSQKAAGAGRASHYYSFSRLAARGEIRLGGRRVAVSGLAWMDHEFGSNQLGPEQAGWDWISLQLSGGRELMLYRMRNRDGTVDPNSSGTLIGPGGRARHLPRGAFRFEGTGRWKSPRSGAVYPMGWRVRVPGEGIDLTVRPLRRAQEMETSGSTRVTYWEGAVDASGTVAGRPATGSGFVEMTGYAKKGRPRF